MELTETGCEGVDWNHVAPGRIQWQAIVNIILTGNFLTSCTTIKFSRDFILKLHLWN